MRIADVCAFYTPQGGGVRTYIERKLRSAPALGHEMVVIAPGPVDHVQDFGNGAILHTVASPALPVDRRYHYFDDETRLHHALDQWRPGHVEVSSPWSSASMVARWGGSSTRSLVMHADPLASYAYRWLGPFATQQRIDRLFDRFWRHLRALDRDVDVVVSPSRGLASRLSQGGLDKVRTVAMGVDPGIFSPTLRSDEVRSKWLRRLGLGEDATLLLAVGRFAGEKRWPMVLRAAAEAGKQADVGLLLVGGGQSEARLQRLADKLPHVHVAGRIGDRREMAVLMASADALVHGCESETFCMVASEAKASGLPLIVPDRGGAYDQIEEQDGGSLAYAAASQADLTRAILHFTATRTAQPASGKMKAVRTLDDHFTELFGLYLLSLPLVDQISDLISLVT